MRWPKPDELRRWTAEDQIVLRKWRRAVFTFYGVVIGLLIFGATSAMRHNERVQPDSVRAFTDRTPFQPTNAALPVMHRSH
jgi:hypothetical protein